MPHLECFIQAFVFALILITAPSVVQLRIIILLRHQQRVLVSVHFVHFLSVSGPQAELQTPKSLLRLRFYHI